MIHKTSDAVRGGWSLSLRGWGLRGGCCPSYMVSLKASLKHYLMYWLSVLQFMQHNTQIKYYE